MSLVPEQAKFLLDICKLIQYATSIGFIVTGGELYRTLEQQEIYLKAGKSKTKNSRHLSRLAMDLNIFRLENDKLVLIEDVKRLSDIKKYWMSLDLKNDCGLNWGWDLNHFERKV